MHRVITPIALLIYAAPVIAEPMITAYPPSVIHSSPQPRYGELPPGAMVPLIGIPVPGHEIVGNGIAPLGTTPCYKPDCGSSADAAPASN
jgi:hypothetical protein